MDQVIGLVLFWAATGAAVILGVLTLIERVTARPDYVAPPPAQQTPTGAVFGGSNAETAKTETTETPPAQLDIAAMRHDVRAAALGALLAQGLVVEGKRTAAVRAVFGDVTGEAYSRAARAVRAAESACVAEAAALAAAPPPPAEPRRIAISEGREGYVEI